MRFFLIQLQLCFFIFSPVFCQIISHDTTFVINDDAAVFSINMGGTLDAENTFSWDTLPYTHFIGFQPMKKLTLENIGQNIIYSPRILINNKHNWYNLNSINEDEAFDSLSTFKEKALSAWKFVRDNRIHRAPPNPSNDGNPVKYLGVYGYLSCTQNTSLLTTLPFNEKKKFYSLINSGHAVGEYKSGLDSALIDSDIESFYLRLDNTSLATKNDIGLDRHLIYRSSHYGKTSRFSTFANRFISSLYDTVLGKESGNTVPYDGYSLDYKLRPGENIIFDWEDGLLYHSNWPYNAHDALSSEIANGKFCLNTNFSNVNVTQMLSSFSNIEISDGSPKVHSLAFEKSSFTFKNSVPFGALGGIIRGRFYKENTMDSIEVFFSQDSLNWIPIKIIEGSGLIFDSISLDNYIQEINALRNFPIWEYYLKFVVTPFSHSSSCGVDSLQIETVFQFSRFFIPSFTLGENKIFYSNNNSESSLVSLKLEWQELSENNPPEKVKAPISPLNGEISKRTMFDLLWENAIDIDGDTITNYEFQLSDRPDMKYPLSPVFDVYTNTKPYFSYSYWQDKIADNSSFAKKENWETPDISRNVLPYELRPTKEIVNASIGQALKSNFGYAAEAKFSIPIEGLLNSDTTYYWRVRARDSKNAWSPWSDVWSFSTKTVMPPVNCKIQLEGDSVRLSWQNNKKGIVPSSYVVYASNEWLGFTPEALNLFEVTSDTSLIFALGEVQPFIFYRIVAVDSNSNKSGVSEIVQISYPYCYKKPEATILDSIFIFKIETSSLWFPSYNGLSGEIVNDEISIDIINKPDWLSWEETSNSFIGIPDSSVSFRMLFDSTFNVIKLKFKGNNSHIENFQEFRLISPFKNSAPFFSEPDSLTVVIQNEFERIITAKDMDIPYGDQVQVQIISMPKWMNEFTQVDSSIKLYGRPEINEIGNFYVVYKACDILNECAKDSFIIEVKDKLKQHVQFDGIVSHKYGDEPFKLNASASSGLNVSFSISQGDDCASIGDNDVLTIQKPGTVVIVASQPGDEVYYEAEPVSQIIEITSGRIGKISVSPNPTSGIVNIVPDGWQTSDASIEIYNELGNLINIENLEPENRVYKIDMFKYSPGVYLARMNILNQINSFKILKY